MKKQSVANWFANEDNLRTFCAECAAMTDENCHTERQIFIAHKFGFEELERKLHNINVVHTDMGYLCEDLAWWRDELSQMVYSEIVRLYGEELATKIWRA